MLVIWHSPGGVQCGQTEVGWWQKRSGLRNYEGFYLSPPEGGEGKGNCVSHSFLSRLRVTLLPKALIHVITCKSSRPIWVILSKNVAYGRVRGGLDYICVKYGQTQICHKKIGDFILTIWCRPKHIHWIELQFFFYFLCCAWFTSYRPLSMVGHHPHK